MSSAQDNDHDNDNLNDPDGRQARTREDAFVIASEQSYGPTATQEDEELDELAPLNEQIRTASANQERSVRTRSKGGYGRNWLSTLFSWHKLRGRSRWATLAIFAVGIAVLLSLLGGAFVYKSKPNGGQSPPWYPSPRGGTLSSWENSYEKAAMMVSKMSLAEKVNVTTGTGWQMGLCVGNTAPAMDVGFPPLCLQDGPLGIRFADNITAFPAGITTGATWNRELMYKRGRLHGLEARLKGVNVLLGPAMGPLGRMPAGGRNWEGFGADPVLQGVAAAETIKGIQDEGVIATAKHYILNEQEHFRQSFEWGLPNALSSNIDDRTLHEIYLWPFAESVRAGVGSIMCSYQMVNNSYACGNSKLMNGILKDELGFQGFAQSDWLAQRSGVGSALAGLDMSMPGDGLRWANGNSLWGTSLTTAILNGSVPISRLNDMVTRIVAAWYQVGQDNTTLFPRPPPFGDGGPNFSSWTHDKMGLLHHGSGGGPSAVVNKYVNVQGEGKDAHGWLVRELAAEGTVLLKNEGKVLPLSRDGGSVEGEGMFRVGVFGEDAGKGDGPNACPDRGCNKGTLGSGWGSGAVDFPYLVAPIDALKSAFNTSSVNLTSDLTNKTPSSDILAHQDVCLVFINANAGEGFLAVSSVKGDRNDLLAQKGGDELVMGVAKGCGGGKGSTVVVIHSVGPIVMEKWIEMEGVKAVVLANLPGQESGNALVDVLFGDVNPSGKLPYTIGKSLQDYGEGGQIMYYPNAVIPQQDFKEGPYIDYRHFDKYNIEPRYEFGYGLSYTNFAISDLNITSIHSRSLFPNPRPSELKPPTYDETIPPPSSVVFPTGFKKLKKYIYPYINSEKDVKHGVYPYPEGYDIIQPLSQAGGGPGGNPSLWDVYAEVEVTLTNVGRVSGKEVVQLYVSFPDNDPIDPLQKFSSNGPFVDFPIKVLRGFEKIELEPRGHTKVKFSLTRKDLSYWSVVYQNWVMPTQGKFVFSVGTSSRNLPLKGIWR